ncbi:MAG: molybdopterin-dependent oxidoreductase [Actinomycetota bacterium]
MRATIDERRTHYRTCPLCEATCGLEITTEGDQVVRIRGDMNDPVSKGFICPKGSTLKQLHEDQDRLRTPMRKTDAGWVEIGWDEAFDEIAERTATVVAEHGRDALGIVIGNPNVHNLGGGVYLRNVIQAVGSTNIFSASTVDQMPKHVSSGLLWGDSGMFPLPDLDRTEYLLMLGANPWASNGSLVTVPDFPGKLKAIQERGGRFVVIDPRVSRTAQEADEHHFIRPGTDVVFLLAVANVLFAENLVDIGRLVDHIDGLDDVRAAVHPFTPEHAEASTGIDADVIRRVARDLAAADHAAVYGRIGTHTVEFGTLSSWAADLLNVLTGNLDEPGGIMFQCAPTVRIGDGEPGGRGYQIGRWTGRASGRPERNGELPAGTLATEILTPGDGQVRAAFVVACNPVRSFPNSARLDEAFESLDFMVSVDPYITATSRHADIVLPPRSALERSHYDFAFERNMIRVFAKYSSAVFETDAPDEPEILCRLALAIKGEGASADPSTEHDGTLRSQVEREVNRADSPIHGRDVDEILAASGEWSWAEQFVDFRLRTGRFGDGYGADPDGLTLRKLVDDHPHGLDFGPLERRFPSAIKTRSGNVELWSEPIAIDMRRLADEPPGHDGLTLVGRRHLRSCNTWMHNVDVLVKGKDRCTLLVHPSDAQAQGLVDGGRAAVRSRVGSVVAPVEVCTDIMPGVVSLPFGWGYDEPGIRMKVAASRPGVNANALTDEAPMDWLSGNAVLNGIPVEVEPV